jgi:hypothetical protein
VIATTPARSYNRESCASSSAKAFRAPEELFFGLGVAPVLRRFSLRYFYLYLLRSILNRRPFVETIRKLSTITPWQRNVSRKAPLFPRSKYTCTPDSGDLYTLPPAAAPGKQGLEVKHSEPDPQRPNWERIPGRYRSGQTGQTVNLLAYAFSGSNPLLPICHSMSHLRYPKQ